MPRRKRNPPDNDPPDGTPFCIDVVIPLRNVADRYIAWALTRLGGDKDVVSEALGLSKKTIYNRIKNSKA